MPTAPSANPSPGIAGRLRGLVDVLYRELIKFGVIGTISFVIDVGLFNLLRHGALDDKPSTAKVVSATVATAFAWVGNRFWTFRHRRNRPIHHELLLFVATNGVALLVGVGVIAFSHYVLGLRTLLADNIANLVGIAIGTVFRFWAYRQFVFAREIKAEEIKAEEIKAEEIESEELQEPHRRHGRPSRRTR